MAIQLEKRLFTVEEYHLMAETGILKEDDRLELIRGELVKMSPIGTRHAACVKRLNQILSQKLGKLVIIGIQDPIRLNDNSEPQPDLALLQPRADFYATAHPQPGDILLLIEVADTTADFDREVKIPLYAQNQITEVWLVDITAQTLAVFREPTPTGYRYQQQLTMGDKVAMAVFPDLEIGVAEFMG
ncbi:MAG TPA: Uma2 family endonuclease [Oscillatoriaceae cyanobacterium M33_DOE_052]|uniref:Uma2 family endonuclease n=1 Tax=Planktothricoides sp. SpSt-374 TaxID=2282167 RepID=A0A7C3VJ68_9CYAN|nr:Uma2 family endonuclease [Oscillatoriaceae cyanobacterium M33_DOE_052]